MWQFPHHNPLPTARIRVGMVTQQTHEQTTNIQAVIRMAERGTAHTSAQTHKSQCAAATTQRHSVPLWKTDCEGYFWRACWKAAALLRGDGGSGCPQAGTAGSITHTPLSSTHPLASSRFQSERFLFPLWAFCSLMQTLACTPTCERLSQRSPHFNTTALVRLWIVLSLVSSLGIPRVKRHQLWMTMQFVVACTMHHSLSPFTIIQRLQQWDCALVWCQNYWKNVFLCMTAPSSWNNDSKNWGLNDVETESKH